MSDWHSRFMDVARLCSTWSHDPSTKVGAVAVSHQRIILSTGWNGFPRGIFDSAERLNDREVKYQYTVHAEMNCIYNATLSGVSLNNSTLYIWGLPICHECAKGVIQSGISTVVIPTYVDMPDRWKSSWSLTRDMFTETGINIITMEKTYTP